MKKILTIIMCLFITAFFSIAGHAQNRFMVSVPIIYSKVEVENNWSPSTAINRKNQFNGKAFGYGINIDYAFHPNFIIKDNHILFNLGVGYFKQTFDIERPFDYVSPLKPIFYTNHYSYLCWQWSAGINYHYPLSQKYFLAGSLSFSQLRSFRQEYTPTSNHGHGDLTQINHHNIDFGNMLLFSLGLNRNLGDRVSLGLNILLPVHTRWRNDKIFKDDPKEFSNPNFSLGSSLSIMYWLSRKI